MVLKINVSRPWT